MELVRGAGTEGAGVSVLGIPSPSTFITALTAESGKTTGPGWKERLPQGHRGSDAPETHPSSQQTQRKTHSALSGHFTCRTLIVILKGAVPQQGVGSSNGKDGPKESSLCRLPG